jgi:hypothetical protein
MATSTDADMAFVDAPTGLTGFLLVMRLPGSQSRNVQDVRGRWIVHVPVDDAAAVRDLLERVQTWMRQERIAETSVSVGEDVYRVGVDYADLQQATEGSR